MDNMFSISFFYFFFFHMKIAVLDSMLLFLFKLDSKLIEIYIQR